MDQPSTTSLERTLTTLGHNEPDRVPLFLFLTMHGAKELGMSLAEYFSRPENVVEGQMRLRARYGHDCVYPLFYAAAEVEAWGGEVLFFDDGPPNAGEPIIRKRSDITSLEPPRVSESPVLQKSLRAIELLKSEVGDEAPVIAAAISPFSLPVMQMGFDSYLDLIYEDRELFWRLMEVNQEFHVEWVNAQLDAGATAIGYFDPVSSGTIIPRELYLETGYEIASRVTERANGPLAIHLASGRCLPIIDDIIASGAAVVGVSALEDIRLLKAACSGRITILGNLNGIEMRRWTHEEAESAVKEAIAGAGQGGGFILADNHGEIPFQVPDEVLFAVSEAARKWGSYPLDWVDEYGV
jgi:uroporphyrinogen decarboxylase